MDMSPINTVAPATPWGQGVARLARVVQQRLAEAPAQEPPRTLWWGGGYSELLSLCGPAPGQPPLVADTDPRRLRRAAAAAGTAVQPIRLLDLADLRRDGAGVEAVLGGAPLRDLDLYLALEERLQQRFQSSPAVADQGVDRLVLDFTLNRIDEAAQPRLLAEAMRVLRRGGRLLCAVLVADEPVAQRLTLRGAPAGPGLRVPTEGALLSAFETAGFHGITLHHAGDAVLQPLDRVGEVDVHLLLVEAFNGKQGPCFELGQAVIYRGPWREVRDDDGHVYPRGARVAVCAKTYELLMRAPFEGAFIGVRSVNEPPLAEAALFDCSTPALRHPRVSKGFEPFVGAQAPASACAPGSGCC